MQLKEGPQGAQRYKKGGDELLGDASTGKSEMLRELAGGG